MGHKEQAVEIVRTCEAADVSDRKAAANEIAGLEALGEAALDGADILKGRVTDADLAAAEAKAAADRDFKAASEARAAAELIAAAAADEAAAAAAATAAADAAAIAANPVVPPPE